MIVVGLYLVIWGKSKDESQSNSKFDPDEIPPVNQQIPMTISIKKLGNEDHDHSLSIAMPPTNETFNKINGK